MKVPRRFSPSTQPSSQGLSGLNIRVNPGAFGVGVSEALGSIGVDLRRIQQEEEQASLFDVNRRVIEETTQAQIDLNERMLNAPLGAQNFTKATLEDYENRHAAIIAEMRERGEPEAAIETMTLRLGELRRSIVGQSVTFQGRSREAKVASDMEQVGLNLSQIASMSPQEMEGALETLNETVDAMPRLSAISKEKLKEQYSESIKLAAGFGLAQQDPLGVIQTLGGAMPEGVFGRASQVASFYEKSFGLSLIAAAAIAGHAVQESNVKATGEVGDSGTAFGVFQWRGERLEQGKAWAQANGKNWDNIQTQLEFAAWEGQHGDLGAQRAWAELQNAETLEEAVAAWMHFERPAGYTSGNPQGGHAYAERLANARKILGEVAPAGKPIDGKTGNPVLDALSPAQRAQILSAARTEYNRKQAAARADLELRTENASAAYMSTGEYDGPPITQGDFYRAYDPAEAEQRWAAFSNTRAVGEFIKGFKTQTQQEIQAQVAALKPTDTSSPTYAVDMKAYEVAQQAQATLLKQRNDDPAGYVIRNFPEVQKAWQRIGEAENPSEARAAAYHAMAEAYRTLGMRPSQHVPMPQSVLDSERERITTLPPEQQVDELVRMRNEMGELYPQALKQFADGGMPVQAYLSGLVADSPEHRAVASNVLRGMEIIENNPAMRPAQAQVDQNFRTAMGSSALVMSPQSANAMNKAAAALYIFNGGDPEVIRPSEFNDALRQVVGGTLEDTSTGIVNMRSWGSAHDFNTILPPGINEDQFTTWEELLTDDALQQISNGVPITRSGQIISAEDLVAHGTFVRTGANEYIVVMNSDGNPVMANNGDYFRVNVTKETVLGGMLLDRIEVEE